MSNEINAVPQITIFSPMFLDFSEEGRDAENDWYDTDHVPQRLAIPGFVSAARYERLASLPFGIDAPSPLKYINAYQVTDPDVVAAEPYLQSYTHLTPRSIVREFSVTAPHFRDVWSMVHAAGQLGTADGARILLLVADEPGDTIPEAEAFLREASVPAMLTLPGVLRAFVFRRADVEVPLSNGLHAPRFLTAYVLSGAEAATRASYGERLSAIAARNTAAGNPVQRAWIGLYDRRPSPWTARPHDSSSA